MPATVVLAAGRGPRRRRADDDATATLRLMLGQTRLPAPETEFKFAAPLRDWRADFAWPDRKLLVEIEGIVPTSETDAAPAWLPRRKKAGGGRHQRLAGFREDCFKYAAAAMLGYAVLRVTPDMVLDGTAVAIIEHVFYSRKAEEAAPVIASFPRPAPRRRR